MIIQSHEILMESNRTSVQHHEKNEQLHVWNNNIRMDIENTEGQTGISIEAFDLVDISREGLAKFQEAANKSVSLKSSFSQQMEEQAELSLPSKYQVAKMILEKFFGIKIEIVKPGEEGEYSDKSQARQVESAQPQEQPASQQPQGWGIHYTYHELNYEKETVNFSAAGNITTADGREINFATELEMSKETLEELNVEYKAGDALIDPLALNFDGKGIGLSSEKIEFDLNSDGNSENISFLEKGSGFLVLDKNQNGMVDDGSELFGPSTNNGFLELKAYDYDQNDWIDENDAIYFQLNLWTKDENGGDQLSSLKDYDVGAIYLNSARTNFDLEEGQLRESGIYLRKNGQVNYIQEVDLETTA